MMSDKKNPSTPESKPHRSAEKPTDPVPPAGPHAKPELTNPDSTPGSGMLPADDAGEDPNAGASG